MNALTSRDTLFSALHSSVLKGQGYNKKGHWCIKNCAPFFLTVYLRASRWSAQSHTTFWIDLQVFNIDCYALMFGPKPFPGPREDTPSLINEELGSLCLPPIHSFEIDASTDVTALEASMSLALRERATPLLDKCSSLEGVLAYYQSSPKLPQFLVSAAAVCLLLNRESEAKQYANKETH